MKFILLIKKRKTGKLWYCPSSNCFLILITVLNTSGSDSDWHENDEATTQFSIVIAHGHIFDNLVTHVITMRKSPN